MTWGENLTLQVDSNILCYTTKSIHEEVIKVQFDVLRSEVFFNTFLTIFWELYICVFEKPIKSLNTSENRTSLINSRNPEKISDDTLRNISFTSRRRNVNGRYHCSSCSYSTNLFSNLKRHNVIHTGECPYSCNVCGRSFNQKDSLKRHFIIHLKTMI
ncbi:UNVERIFIED_CONTAM: zinc finger protein [Trichonephila clavipes]